MAQSVEVYLCVCLCAVTHSLCSTNNTILPIYPSIHPAIHLSYIHPSIHLYVCVCVCVCVSICVCVNLYTCIKVPLMQLQQMWDIHPLIFG